MGRSWPVAAGLLLLLGPGCLVAAAQHRAAPESAMLANQPVFSPDGKWIAFTYHGDLWRVAARGGSAARLTSHPDREARPLYSPDGKWIVFSSDREGLFDLYVMPAEGGNPRRLTWHGSSSDYAYSFSPDGGQVYFYSNREGYRDLYRVPLGGGTPVRLSGEPYTMEYYPAVSPDGKTLAFCRRSAPGAMVRAGYHGSNNADIWLADLTLPLSNFRQVTVHDGHDMFPVFAPDGKGLYFISEMDGAQNVYYAETSANAQEAERKREKMRAVTGFKNGSLSHLDLSRDGRTLLFVRDFQLWTASTRTGRAEPLPLRIDTDLKENPLAPAVHSGGAEEFAVSPDQKKVAYAVGHEIVITPADDNPSTRQVTRTAERELAPLWFPDSRRLLYLSMRDGNREIYAYDAVLDSSTRLTRTSEDESSLAWTPDGKRLAYLRGEREIMLYDPETDTHEKIAESYYALAGLHQREVFAFSPDGRWLAFVTDGPNYTQALSVKEVTGETVQRVTRLLPECSSPAWSPDGRSLALIATEGGHRDLYVIDLIKSPEQKFDVDALEQLLAASAPKAASPAASSTPEAAGKVGKETPEKVAPVEIVFEGIEERMRKLTSGEASEWNPVWSKDSQEIYFFSTMSGSPNLWSTPADPASEKKRAMLTSTSGGKSGLALSPDGKTAWYLEGGLARKLTLASKSVSAIPFRVEMMVDRQAVRRAAFHEAWWVMDRYFYDREHHGVDWEAARRQAEQALAHVASDDELAWVLGSLIGDLQASHTGVITRPSGGDGRRPHKHTGILLDPVELERGRFVAARVLRESPADQPQARVVAGEEIVAVNGHPLAPGDNLDRRLLESVEEKINLTLAAQRDGETATREVGLRPVGRRAFLDLLYEDWVYHNRQYVLEKSAGRLGYLHVRSMDGDSLERFKREIPSQAADKEGVLLDVRFNPGGHIAVHLLEILMKRPFLIREVGERGEISENWLRSLALEKPTVLLINERSGSNSEILAEGYRRLGLGKIVGMPTPGDVIGTGRYTLVNGFGLRRPYIGAYTLEGENLEGTGRQPDILVDHTPEDEAAGRRPQLDAAIRALLEELRAGR